MPRIITSGPDDPLPLSIDALVQRLILGGGLDLLLEADPSKLWAVLGDDNERGPTLIVERKIPVGEGGVPDRRRGVDPRGVVPRPALVG